MREDTTLQSNNLAVTLLQSDDTSPPPPATLEALSQSTAEFLVFGSKEHSEDLSAFVGRAIDVMGRSPRTGLVWNAREPQALVLRRDIYAKLNGLDPSAPTYQQFESLYARAKVLRCCNSVRIGPDERLPTP